MLDEATATKWANSALRGHRTTTAARIQDLRTDLADGIILAELLENLSKIKFHYQREGKLLRIKPQKMENLSFSFKLMEKDNVKLVNIGPEDLYSGNLKLILGLIWTLIRRYQIRSTGRALSTKDSMLAWVNTQLAPKMSVKNFTVDWNNGLAICRLVERVRPGLIPDWGSLKPTDMLKNCRLAMTLAEEKLDIPKILEPEDLCHADVDEISVMTYISYFCNPINTHLLNWVQQTIPHRNIKNFNTDWNDGVSLAHLLEALNPGGFTDCTKLDPRNALDNLARAMKAADDQLGIKPILKPDQMADPKVDELNVATYLSRFQNAKPLPQPQAVVCSGEGLRKAIVRQQAVFEVDTSRGGSGDLGVEITRKSGGKPVSAKISPTSGKKAVLTVSYTTDIAGDLSIAVKWSGSQLPSSPYLVHVLDPKSVTLTGPQITGGECAKVGQLVKMEASGVSEITDFEVMVEFSNGQKEEAKIVAAGKGAVQCSYAARVVGKDKITAKIGGVAIKGSPYTVKVFDPKLFSVTLRDPPPGKPLSINSKATLVVSSSQGAVEGAVACLVSSTGSQEITLRTQGDGSTLGVVTPVSVGKQEIQVTCGGDAIKGSPITLQVFDSSMCSLEDIPGYLHVNQSHSIGLSLKGAGEGTAEAKSSDSRVLAVECQPEGKDKYVIKLTPKMVGECSVSVEWNGKAVGQSPQKVSVVDATKVTAYGPGLSTGQGKVGQLFVFTVQAKGAGSGEVSVVAKGPKKAPYPADISKNPDGTYKVSFTTYENGSHTVEVLWSGKGIPTSPHAVEFKKPADANAFTATGDGLKTAVALSVAKFVIAGPEPDLLSSKTLDISLSSGSIKSTLVTDKTAFAPASKKAVVFASDTGKGTYSVSYSAPSAGKYSLAVTSDGDNIPGSPFSVEVLPAPDAGKCRAFGHALDNPNSLIVLKPLEFKVETTNAGVGVLTVTCKNPQGDTVPVFLAEDKSNPKQKVHSVKIDPSVKGKFEVSVQWSEKDIPKSPFVFDVGNPKDVIIIDLADSADFIGRKGEVMSFSVDARKAGHGEVKAAAKYDDGKLVLYEQKKNKDGTLKLSHTPTKEGRMELLLTYSGANILPLPWVVDVIDPAAFKVIVPKEPGRLNEYVKFVLVGVQKKRAKNILVTAKNKSHEATVKMEFSDKTQAVASFIPKEIGVYTVEVKVASKNIPGSPFKCSVVDPTKCIINDGDIPKVVMIGSEKKFKVDTTKAGPGELTIECLSDDGTPSSCLKNIVSSGFVKLAGKACGKCTIVLKFAGFPITSKATEVFVTDPSKCTYSCKGIVNGCCKTNSDIVVDVDCSHGGNYPPTIEAKGPKSRYDIEVKKVTEGHYTMTFAPWQEGANKIDVLIGGVKIPGSPMSFKSEQPMDAGKVKVGGPGLKGGVANRRSEITIYARESMLVDKGLLKVFIDGEAGKTLEILDKNNGTYAVSYVPSAKGTMTLSVTGDGHNVAGSPFSISVAPEPDASKCKVQNRSGDEVFASSSSMYCKVRTPFELGVVTSGAGSGVVSASGTAPNNSPIRVFTKEEKSNGEDITYVKFDPISVGVHTLSIAWENQSLQGSPYSIKVVDPTKCVFTDPFPSSVKVGDKAVLRVDTSAMGEGELEAFSSGSSVEVEAVMKKAGMYELTIIGVSLGSATVDIKFGGLDVTGSPYALNICDPSMCTSDFETGVMTLGVPFKFRVKTEGAGKAKLNVVSSKKGTHQVKNIENSTWEVTFTAREMGEYILNVLWGEWDVAGSPFTFSVCDPSKVKIKGLRDPKDVILVGEPVSFNIDSALAGPGKLSCYTVCDGKSEELTWDETDGNSDALSLQFVPTAPGKVELHLEFNGMDILMKPHIYEVPDPTQFKVTAPSGFGKLNEHLKFSVTGVKHSTDLSVIATINGQDVPVKTKIGSDGTTAVARFTPTIIGDYCIEVKHSGQHISGSPFTMQVSNPDGCKFVGELPTVVHSGGGPVLRMDYSEAGPGELEFDTEVLSGEENSLIRSQEEEGVWVFSDGDAVGKYKITGRWGGYVIAGTPFVLSIVDSMRVTWSGEITEGQIITQGEQLNFLIDGSAAGEMALKIRAVGPDGEEYPVKIVTNDNGSYTVTINPWKVGKNQVFIMWGDKPIPNSPITFEVMKGIESRAITASGEGFKSATISTMTYIMINAIESGLLERGFLVARLVKDELDYPFDVSDKGDGMYEFRFMPLEEGTYYLNITYKGDHIHGSPFEIVVGLGAMADKCRAFGEAIEKKPAIFVADFPIQFSVDTSAAGSGTLTTSASLEGNEPVYVYTLQEGANHHLKFNPVQVGDYEVEVKWGGEDIPGSPFLFKVVDPQKCIVKGFPEGNHMQKDETMSFTVDMSKVGDYDPVVKVTVQQQVTELKAVTVSDKIYTYSYTAKHIGMTLISVTVAGEDVLGSPFSLSVDDVNTFSIVGINLQKDYGIVCEPITIKISGEKSEEEPLLVTAHGPSADLHVETVQDEDDDELYSATFVPLEPGSYEVFVEYAGSHVSGSPMSVKVADPSKCQLLGGVLSTLQVGDTGEMIVKTRGAGEGELKAFVNTTSTLDCVVKDQGLDTYMVCLTGKAIGKATVDLQWAGFTIPSNPFPVNVCDARKCHAHGKVFDSRKAKAGVPIKFNVETEGAGKTQLKVTANGPTAQYTVNIEELGETTYEVSFTPWEIGSHIVNIFWGTEHVPESPLDVNVGSPMEMEICNATGDGLKHGIARQKATFTVICSEMGLLDKDVLKVNVMGVKEHANVKMTDQNNGCYTVEYTPPTPGAYVASVMFHGKHITGSPFKIKVDSGPDASKCKAYGPALHPNTLAIAGSPLEFFVDTSEAGYGKLRVLVQGPNDYRPRVFLADDEKGVHSVKFDAMKPGKYMIVAVWSEDHIPNSPFRLRVHPAADASQVKASGPGLLDSFIGTPGNFHVETKRAGIGTLLVRVHGLKDSFKIEASPLSAEDPRTMVISYNPKLVAEYTVFVRWSGVHIPGSPFTVGIRQKPGEYDPAVEPVFPKQVVKKKEKVSGKRVVHHSGGNVYLKEPERSITQKNHISSDSQQQHTSEFLTQEQLQASTASRTTTSSVHKPVISQTPSGMGITVGGTGAMVLRENPAMAMALAQSVPPGQKQGGYVSQQESAYQQKYKVKKKVVKKASRKNTRSSAAERATSPGRSGTAKGATNAKALSPQTKSKKLQSTQQQVAVTRTVSPDAARKSRAVSKQQVAVTRTVSPDATRKSQAVSKQQVAVTRTVSPDAARRRQQVAVTRTVSPDAVRRSREVSKQQVAVTRTVSPDAARRSREVSKQQVAVTRTVSPDAARRSREVSKQQVAVTRTVSPDAARRSREVSKQQVAVTRTVSPDAARRSREVSKQQVAVTRTVSPDAARRSREVSKQQVAVTRTVSPDAARRSREVSKQQVAVTRTVSPDAARKSWEVSQKQQQQIQQQQQQQWQQQQQQQRQQQQQQQSSHSSRQQTVNVTRTVSSTSASAGRSGGVSSGKVVSQQRSQASQQQQQQQQQQRATHIVVSPGGEAVSSSRVVAQRQSSSQQQQIGVAATTHVLTTQGSSSKVVSSQSSHQGAPGTAYIMTSTSPTRVVSQQSSQQSSQQVTGGETRVVSQSSHHQRSGSATRVVTSQSSHHRSESATRMVTSSGGGQTGHVTTVVERERTTSPTRQQVQQQERKVKVVVKRGRRPTKGASSGKKH